MALDDDELAQVAAGKAMVILQEHPSWKLFCKAIELAVSDRVRMIEAPVSSLQDSLSQNYAKGTIAGLRLALSMPAYTVAEMVSLQEKAQEADNEEDESDDS